MILKGQLNPKGLIISFVLIGHIYQAWYTPNLISKQECLLVEGPPPACWLRVKHLQFDLGMTLTSFMILKD